MKLTGIIPLIFFVASLATLLAAFWQSDRDRARHCQAASHVLMICFAFSLVWAVWT